jgi:glycosyltransferase involved in cell wall biosynthesis
MNILQPLISICIPAYKRIDYLQRLLQSICDQKFTDFEVIVTDDSRDETVKELCHQYWNLFALVYHRNEKPLGTPENWHEAIRHAKGKWIKLMHDDDWFADENSLFFFADSLNDHPHASFFFSGYRNVYAEGPGKTKDVFAASSRYKMLATNPAILYTGNIIGPPSCVLYKQNKEIFFDRRLSWLVDIDFYIRYLSFSSAVYIPKILVNIGISSAQVTSSSFRKKEIEIPENFLLLEKLGTKVLSNIQVFDTWWRLIRNLKINDVEEIRQAGYQGRIPARILSILNFQSNMPAKFLKYGFLSKMAMSICFLLSPREKS